MTAYQLFVIVGFLIIVPMYLIYLFQKRKEESDESMTGSLRETTDKILLALRELAKHQPEFGEYLHKIGLL